MQLPFDRTSAKFSDETDHAIQNNRYVRGDLFIDIAKRFVAPNGEILDYGCGPGRISFMLAEAGFRVHGVDISEGMIARARALDRGHLQLDFSLIAHDEDVVETRSYDAIVCSSVIEYVVDPPALLNRLRSVLKQSGTLIISFANASSIFRQRWDKKSNPMYMPHNHTWHAKEFRDLLLCNGFQDVTKPQFFESPLDWYPPQRLLRRMSFGGSIGVLAAKPATPKGA